MFLYGSGIPNLSRQIGIPEHEMGKCVAKFKESLPALDNLIDRVQGAAKRNGYLMSVDGRWGRVRSKNGKIALNTALNVLLQMTGSLVMKYAHIKAEELCVECGYIETFAQFPMVAHVHDEAQTEIKESEVEILDYWVAEDKWKDEEKRQHIDNKGRIWSAPEKLSVHEGMLGVRRMFHIVGHNYCTALVWAGETLKLRCATAGEYKIAYNWGGTH